MIGMLILLGSLRKTFRSRLVGNKLYYPKISYPGIRITYPTMYMGQLIPSLWYNR